MNTMRHTPERNCRYCKGTGEKPLLNHIYYKSEHAERGFRVCPCTIVAPGLNKAIQRAHKDRIARMKNKIARSKVRAI